MKYKFKAIKTGFWRPGEDYVKIILNSIKSHLMDGDIIVLSEKALSTAKGNLVDESLYQPSLLAKLIARFWMRFIWGFFLGKLCNLKPDAIQHLRKYPRREGSIHKQVVLSYGTLLQAMKHGSENGIDISNLPYGYACLPLKYSKFEAFLIFNEINDKIGIKPIVMIVDTDSTFTYHNFHFTSRPQPIDGIKSLGGVLSFVIGRALKLKQRATPLAIVGSQMSLENALNLAELAHHVRGYGAGRTVWDIARKHDVSLNGITWEILEKVDHYPIVLIRRK
jgi:F420-0:gamma-glutamyl ligase-like protein